MSLIGFDIGNNSCATAVTKPRTIQILQDDEANYETPSLISFAEKKRHFGSYAASLSIANPSSTLSQIKRLVGKEYGAIRSELDELPFTTSKADDGGIMIEVDHCGSTRKFTVVQILAMLMSYLKKGAEKNLGVPVTNCVIGIPSYFSDRERFAYLDAAEIAGLKPLKLMHEGTAIALGYGIYNQNYQGNVVFVDVGHCATQVTLVSFKEGEMYVLSHASDENLGGRDFDRILYDHFSIYFITRFGIEVRFANKRARARLLSECEKLKKVLSANKEARMSIECLVDGTDVDGSITRDEFTMLSLNLLGRLRQTCKRAVAGNKELLVGTVELVGSASRIPAISDVLIGYFGNIISRTLNASECVARGCALQCSMLSPNSRFSKYIIKDSIPFNIEVLNNKIMNPLFVKGEHFPSDKSINLCIGKDEFIDLGSSRQQDTSCTPFQLIRRFKVIGNFKRGNPNSRVQVMFRFDYHGCITVQSARVIEMDCWGRWQELNILQVESFPFKMLDPAIDDEKAVLSGFTENDNLIEETHNQKNLLETHLNETRKKLTGQFKNFASDSEKDYISQWLKDTKTWLYKDGEDVSKGVYMDKLSELKHLLDPIESCFRRSHATNQAKGELVKNITSRRSDVACLPLATKNAIDVETDCANEVRAGEAKLSSLDIQNTSEKEYDMACIDEVVLETKERCFCNFCIHLKDLIGEQEEQCFANKLKVTESEFDIGILPGYISDPSFDQCDLDNAAALIRCFGSRLEHDQPQLDEVVKRVQKVTKMLVSSGVPLTGWVDGSRSLLRAWKLRNQAIEHDKLIEATEASMVLQFQYVDDLRAQHVSIDGELSTKNLSLSSFKEESALIQSKINQTKAELDELCKKFAHVTYELDAEAKLCIHLEGRRRDVEDQLSTAELEVSNRKKKLEEMKSDRNRDTANVAVEQAIKNITSLSNGVAGQEVIEVDYWGNRRESNINLQSVESSPVKMIDPAIDDAKAVLSGFTEKDNLIEETHNQKNLLESQLNETRKKLIGQFKNFASDSEKDCIFQWLKDTKTWLYKDGEDVSKDVYMDKLSELKQFRECVRGEIGEEEE